MRGERKFSKAGFYLVLALIIHLFTAVQTYSQLPLEVKWSQSPNMTDGFNVASWTDLITTYTLVGDDWLCITGKPIVHLRWWGSYKGWQETVAGPVLPPPVRPFGFLLRMHQYLPGPPYSRPGRLLRSEFCRKFTEAYYGAVPIWNKPGHYEHEFVYDYKLRFPWFQQADRKYFLIIQALYLRPRPPFPWGWKNSDLHWNDDAVQRFGWGRWLELRWPAGHRLAGESMDMAFELLEPALTPTPTPTHTPGPTPTPRPTPTHTPGPTPTPTPTPAISLGEAVDNTALSWTTGGNAPWFGQTTTYFYYGDAAQSGAISHLQASVVHTSVQGPGLLRFYWKVSSQADHDRLIFSIDAMPQAHISGEVDWQQKTYTIPSGSHHLTWSYVKDYSMSSGADCGWLDKVEWLSLIVPH